MISYSYPALITSLALLLYVFTVIRVVFGRRKYRIMAPVVTGHPEFERRFRIQQNTLEQLLLFLPSLWVFSFFVSPVVASIPGLFILGRLIYIISYSYNPEWRRPGFAIGAIVSLVLLIGGTGAVVKLILENHL